MKLTFNREEIEIANVLSLGELLKVRGIASRGVAVAVNGKVVTRAAWDYTALSDGDNIMVITAVCGG